MWGGGFKSGYEGLYLSVHILLHNLLDFVGLDNAKIKAAVKRYPRRGCIDKKHYAGGIIVDCIRARA